MLTALFRDYLIPGFETGFKKRRIWEYWRELERTQWLPRPQIEAIQLAALQKLLAHAEARCPYYRDLWRERGLAARCVSSLEDFSRWPRLDRDLIREQRMRMRAEGDVALQSKATGGSSGTPLSFDLDPNSYERRFAAWNRGYGWAGGAPGTLQWWLWGVPLGKRPLWREWKDTLYQRLYRRHVINCFHLSEATARDYVSSLNRCRPDVIVAYTNSIELLARMAREQKLEPFSPKAIIVGAEKLYDYQRSVIESVFGAPVFETYGSREFMLMGAECDRHAGLHLTTEQLLLEVVDDDGRPAAPGTEGRVVVTDLYNYGMPFIRYVNGDRAIAGLVDCACGRGLPMIQRIIGRSADVIESPDGRRLTGLFFPHLIKDFSLVRRFQVAQEEKDAVVVRLVMEDGADGPAQMARIEELVREALGPSMRVRVERVSHIALTAAGKHRPVLAYRPPAPEA